MEEDIKWPSVVNRNAGEDISEPVPPRRKVFANIRKRKETSEKKRKQALALYIAGRPVSVISKDLGIANNTAKKWRTLDRWDDARRIAQGETTVKDVERTGPKLPEKTAEVAVMLEPFYRVVAKTLARATKKASMELASMEPAEILKKTKELKNLADASDKIFSENKAKKEEHAPMFNINMGDIVVRKVEDADATPYQIEENQ